MKDVVCARPDAGTADGLPRGGSPGRAGSGFTLVELLVVITVLAIIAGLLLPASSRAAAHAKRIACVNQQRQLQLAASLYSQAYGGALCPNRSELAGEYSRSTAGSWVVGNARFDPASTTITEGALYPSVQDVASYHCPADRSSLVTDTARPRLRSYMLNYLLNGTMPRSRLVDWNKVLETQILDPVRTFGFIDAAEHIINDGMFVVWPNATDMSRDRWVDLPADRHAQGAVLSFMDGHVEWHRWTTPTAGRDLGSEASGRMLGDLRWLQERLPEP